MNERLLRLMRFRAEAFPGSWRGVVLAVLGLALIGPIARLSSQPSVRSPVARKLAATRCREYREILRAYASTADSDGRLAITARWIQEGPAHLQRIESGGALTQKEIDQVQTVRTAMDATNASPPRRIAQAQGFAMHLVSIAHGLAQLEKSLDP